MIRLLDAKGQILGLKSKQDAEEYAHKHNMVLKFMPVTAKSKYTEYMAIPRSEMTFECENDDEKQVDAKEDSKKMLLQVKKLTFNYNIQENDLEVKIRAVRKHVKKNCEVRLLVTGSEGKDQVLEQIYSKFHQELDLECRFLQKKISHNNLKFVILPKGNLHSQEDKKESKRCTKDDTQQISSDQLFEEGELEQLLNERLKK
jgi:translation initiation factor IF-3, C-terminal domain